MSPGAAIFVFWILLIILILAILVVTGVLWPDYKTESWYYIALVGTGMLYLASVAMSMNGDIKDLLSNMSKAFSDKVATQ